MQGGRRQHIAIKGEEKLKNDKHSQGHQLIDSNFMPMACEISGTDLLKMVTAAEENHVPHSVLLRMWFSVYQLLFKPLTQD